MPKFGMKVPHLRCDSNTSFEVKWSKVGVTDGQGHTVPTITSSLRHANKYPAIFAKTTKFKNSFICYGLSHYQLTAELESY